VAGKLHRTRSQGRARGRDLLDCYDCAVSGGAAKASEVDVRTLAGGIFTSALIELTNGRSAAAYDNEERVPKAFDAVSHFGPMAIVQQPAAQSPSRRRFCSAGLLLELRGQTCSSPARNFAFCCGGSSPVRKPHMRSRPVLKPSSVRRLKNAQSRAERYPCTT
jgi:hypothetical protein